MNIQSKRNNSSNNKSSKNINQKHNKQKQREFTVKEIKSKTSMDGNYRIIAKKWSKNILADRLPKT